MDSKIFTLGALMGALFVFATFQVTVCVDPGSHAVSAAGAVTRNGPLLPSTVTCIVDELIPPRVSRAVT